MKTHLYKKEIYDICYKNHITALEIYERLSKQNLNISKSSVYRNIDKLVETWELKRLEWIWKQAYFEANIWNHIHLIDKNTWKITDIDDLNNIPKNFNIKLIDTKVFWKFVK